MSIDLKTRTGFVLLYIYFGINPSFLFKEQGSRKWSFEFAFGRPKLGFIHGLDFGPKIK